jgi:hypothetical protein
MSGLRNISMLFQNSRTGHKTRRRRQAQPGGPAGDELNCKIYIGPFEIFLIQEAGGIRINYGT